MSDRAKKIALIACILALIGFGYALIPQDVAFEVVLNNTNLAPTFVGGPTGTNERISGITYWANTSAKQILLFSHGMTVADTTTIELWVNGTMVLVTSGKPLGGAETSNKSLSMIIPKGSYYHAIFNNYHHYEWREYPIISGRNGTLSINQTIINSGGGVSFDGSTINLNGSMLWNGTFNGTMNHSNLTRLDYGSSGHTGFVGSTVGQTFNVATASEMNATLLNLSLHPDLNGNVIIQVTDNLTGDFTIPALSYNGYDLTIQGTLTEVLIDTATGGAAQVNGISKGYYEKNTASYTPNLYRNKLMSNPSGGYVAIDSNNATRINYSAAPNSFTFFSNGQTAHVYDWKHTITGMVTVSPYAKVTFSNISINNTVNTAVNAKDFSFVKSRKSYFNSTHNNGAAYVNVLSSWNSLSSVYSGSQVAVRLDMGSSYYSRDLFSENMGGDIYFLSRNPTGLKTGLLVPISSKLQIFNFCDNSEDSKPSGSRGVYVLDGGIGLIQAGFVSGYQTGVLAQFAASLRNSTVLYSDYTTQFNPAGVVDPSYIG